MRQCGFQLVQLIVALAVMAGALVATLPSLLNWSSAHRLRLAAAEFVSAMRSARLAAVSGGVKVGLKFRSHDEGRVTYTLHRDGDGDGIRSSDIARGVDPQIGPRRELRFVGARVRLGFPPGVEPSDPGDPSRRLDRLGDPIRFGRSDIASFNALGRSSPGTLYLTDSRLGLVAVRVLAASGRVRVLVYNATDDRWRPG